MPTTQDKLMAHRRAFIATPSELGSEAVKSLSGAPRNHQLYYTVCALRDTAPTRVSM
jgi:hypothetical protein